MHAKSLQPCLTLFDPMNSSLPGSSVHGVLQARILEWVASSFSRTRWWSESSSCTWKSHLDLKSYLQAVWSGPFLSLVFSFRKGGGGVPPLQGFHEHCTEKGAHSAWTHSRHSAMIILLTISYHCCICMLSHFSCVWLFATLWTIACQAPLSLGILQARILEWVSLSPLQGIFPIFPGINPAPLMSLTLAGRLFYH